MSTTAERPSPSYQVVVNQRGQYSIWPLGHPPPAGWRAAPASGTREVCLAYIEETWSSLVPLVLTSEPS